MNNLVSSNNNIVHHIVRCFNSFNDMIISIKLIQQVVGNLECGKSAGPDGFLDPPPLPQYQSDKCILFYS